MKIILETDRLWLREFTVEDAEFIIELVNSDGWLQFIGDRHIKTIDQAIQYLQNGPMKSYVENGYGLSLIQRKEGLQKIGMCGIIRRDTLATPDIGFALLPDYFNQGYAFEIASATLKHAKEHFGIKDICAITVPENVSSISLIQKLGLTFKENFISGDSNEKLQLYA